MATDADIHAQALERRKEAQDYWSPYYQQIEEDVDFALNEDNEQWSDIPVGNPDDIRLVYNKTQAQILNVVNEMRASRPAIKTSPANGEADKDTANIISGLIRKIEYRSDAPTAYDVAAFTQVAAGLGFVRVRLDYIKGTFDQEPIIETVPDVHSVLIDPLSQELDGSDSRYAFVMRENMTKEEFEDTYPNASPVDFDKGNKTGWCDDKTIRTAEYYYTEFETRTLVLLDSGVTLTKEEYETIVPSVPEGFPIPQIIKERDEQVKIIKHCVLNGEEILEKTEWLSEYIPVIPFYGMTLFNAGKRHISGMVKVLRDPQKDYNWSKSADARSIALQPVAPWTAYEGVITKENEKYWVGANVKNYPVLTAAPVVQSGILLPLPQRQMPPQPNAAMIQRAMMASEDMKSVVGQVYDEGGKTLGAESGSAIFQKERKAQASNFHFIDNQSKSIAQIGRILVDLARKVYVGPRDEKIINEDGSEETVPLNKRGEIKRDGKKTQGIYNLSSGDYDVTVSVGKTYASRQQEGVAAMLELTGMLPQVMATSADIIARNIDAPGMDQVADRIKKTLPPGIADDDVTPDKVALNNAQQAIEMLKSKLIEMDKALLDKTRSEDQKHKIDLLNTELKKQEIEIKEFEASLEAAKIQLDANQRMQPQDFAAMVKFMTAMQEKLDDTSSALDLLTDALPEILPQAEQGLPQPPLPEQASV